MYCPQCGNVNTDDASFCTKCGFDLAEHRRQWQVPAAMSQAPEDNPGGEPANGQPAPPAAPPPAASSPAASPPPYQQQSQPSYQTPPPYQTPPYQGSPYPTTPYQPAAGYSPGGQPGYGLVPHIPSYMGWAIATLILCFWPTGIVAVVFASRVGNRLALGDIPGAQEASRKAKMWTWITFAIGVALWVIAIIGIVIAAATAVNTLNVY